MASTTWNSLKFWNSEEWDELQDLWTEDKYTIPTLQKVFRPLIETPFEKVKVVMLSREPYNGLRHEPDGLAFSAANQQGQVQDLPLPLLNLLREAVDDVSIRPPKHGSLKRWAKQGVLLWNTIPTTKIGSPYAHLHRGWHKLTREILDSLYKKDKTIVFVAWQPVPESILPTGCIKVSGPGPTPNHASHFLGSRPFSRINNLLKVHDKMPIDWNLS